MDKLPTHLIGVDCATQDSKIGLAHGVLEAGVMAVERADICSRDTRAAAAVAEWIRQGPLPALIAIDAPLGWPAPMAALASHRAGGPIDVPSNELFRRETDRFIKSMTGKTSLDVGADRIARTAHSALRLLKDLRELLEQPIELAWSPTSLAAISAIEVYPAATLGVHGIRAGGYKDSTSIAEREEIIRGLGAAVEGGMRLPLDTGAMARNADVLDAVVCLLAAHDFLAEKAAPPENIERARKEGWIWCRRP